MVPNKYVCGWDCYRWAACRIGVAAVKWAVLLFLHVYILRHGGVGRDTLGSGFAGVLLVGGVLPWAIKLLSYYTFVAFTFYTEECPH